VITTDAPEHERMLADVKKLMGTDEHLTPERGRRACGGHGDCIASINGEDSHASRVIALLPQTVKRNLPDFGLDLGTLWSENCN
jgi:hypothetical protein